MQQHDFHKRYQNSYSCACSCQRKRVNQSFEVFMLFITRTTFITNQWIRFYHLQTQPQLFKFKTHSIVFVIEIRFVYLGFSWKNSLWSIKINFQAPNSAITRCCSCFSSVRPLSCLWTSIWGLGSRHASRKAIRCTALKASTIRWRGSSRRSNIFSSNRHSSCFRLGRETRLVSSSKDKNIHLYLSLLQEEFLFQSLTWSGVRSMVKMELTRRDSFRLISDRQECFNRTRLSLPRIWEISGSIVRAGGGWEGLQNISMRFELIFVSLSSDGFVDNTRCYESESESALKINRNFRISAVHEKHWKINSGYVFENEEA